MPTLGTRLTLALSFCSETLAPADGWPRGVENRPTTTVAHRGRSRRVRRRLLPCGVAPPSPIEAALARGPMKLIALVTGLTLPLIPLAALGCGAADEPTSVESQDLTLPGFPDGGPFSLPPLPPLPTGFPLPALPDGGFALPPLPTGFPLPVPSGGFTLPPLPTGFPLPVIPDGGFAFPPLPTLPTALPVPVLPQPPPLPTAFPVPTLPTGFPLPSFPDGGPFFPLPPIPGVP